MFLPRVAASWPLAQHPKPEAAIPRLNRSSYPES
jgi:hypothetical protein